MEDTSGVSPRLPRIRVVSDVGAGLPRTYCSGAPWCRWLSRRQVRGEPALTAPGESPRPRLMTGSRRNSFLWEAICTRLPRP